MSERNDLIQVVALTQDFLNRYMPQLIALDEKVQREFGDTYSNESWGAEEFSRDLPAKWSYSALAIQGDRVCGFWIASSRTPTMVYTHRVAVERDKRRFGIGKKMFDFVLSKARKGGFSMMGLSVSIYNIQAIQFYESMGFVRVTDKRITDILGGKASHFVVEGDYYRTLSDQRNYLYMLNFRGGKR